MLAAVRSPACCQRTFRFAYPRLRLRGPAQWGRSLVERSTWSAVSRESSAGISVYLRAYCLGAVVLTCGFERMLEASGQVAIPPRPIECLQMPRTLNATGVLFGFLILNICPTSTVNGPVYTGKPVSSIPIAPRIVSRRTSETQLRWLDLDRHDGPAVEVRRSGERKSKFPST